MDAVSYSKASSAYKLAGQAIVGLTTKANLTTSGILVPVGTTATRPTLGAGEATIRFNTDLGGLEEWNGTGWFNVSADITAVALKGADTVANILAKTGMVAEDLWIASDTLDGYVYDGSSWINIGPLQGPQGIQGVQGIQGIQGVQGNIGPNGLTAYEVAVVNGYVGTEAAWLLTLVGPQGVQGIQGIQGITGNGVSTVVKTSTAGLVDTYTITFTDATTTTFNVTNGLNGTNGVDGQDIDHVSKTAGTSAPGTTDTYTVWGDLTETINLGTFSVYNGADGLGTGDMLKTTYDTTNNGIVDNAEKVNGLTVETAVPIGAVFTDTVYTLPASVVHDTESGALHATDALRVSGTTLSLYKGDGTFESVDTQDTVYTHPTTDGSLHVPATSTTNSGKVLTAGATAGSITWETPASGVTDHTLLTNIGTRTHAQLESDIAAKAPLASPVFTGNVTGLGVSTGTSFNAITGLASAAPLIDGTAAVGTSTLTARQDHVHPSDTSRLALAGDTMTGALNTTQIDKGTVSTGTVTFTQSAGNVQRLQVGGALTIALNGWATSGIFADILLRLVNAGSATVTLPTINWIKPDGTLTTTFSTYLTAIARPALQTSGVDFMYLFTLDAGTTVYGKLL